MIDARIAHILKASGVELALSLPCNMLSGILDETDRAGIRRIPVCREEEGVGIAAGAALAGRRAALLMQNSGLGNSINALASLTCFYRLPLFLLMSLRGGPAEPIAAQVPMGKTAPMLLEALSIEYLKISAPSQLENLQTFMTACFERGTVGAVFLSPELWHAQG